MRNNYRQRRTRLGLTKEQVAGVANVSLSTLVRVENAKRMTFQQNTLNAIDRALSDLESQRQEGKL